MEEISMPKKKKLRLDSLAVNSFITSEESKYVRGREGSTGSPYLDCEPYCADPVTDPNITKTCYDSCYGSCDGSCFNTCDCESVEPRFCDTPPW